MCRDARNAGQKGKDIKAGALKAPFCQIGLVVASTAEDQNQDPDPVTAATIVVITSVKETETTSAMVVATAAE